MNTAMLWEQALALGIIQGLTEFLPVSSSGHLVLGQSLLGLKEPALTFDILLHVGTLVAVLSFYGRDVWRVARGWARSLAGKAQTEGERTAARVGWLIILGTIPAALAGGGFQGFIEGMFGNTRLAGYALLATGALLYLSARQAPGERGEEMMTWKDALLIGVFQALAIVPGISRSGATIAVALFLGIEREQAARFSFMLSIPAILGAFVLKAKNLADTPNSALGAYLLGAAAAALVGALALAWLVRLLRRGNLGRFSYYCWGVGVLAIVLL